MYLNVLVCIKCLEIGDNISILLNDRGRKQAWSNEGNS